MGPSYIKRPHAIPKSRADEDIRPYESGMPDTVADAIRPCGASPTGGQPLAPSHNLPPDGRGGEAKLRKKFFAKLSFKKAA